MEEEMDKAEISSGPSDVNGDKIGNIADDDDDDVHAWRWMGCRWCASSCSGKRGLGRLRGRGVEP